MHIRYKTGEGGLLYGCGVVWVFLTKPFLKLSQSISFKALEICGACCVKLLQPKPAVVLHARSRVKTSLAHGTGDHTPSKRQRRFVPFGNWWRQASYLSIKSNIQQKKKQTKHHLTGLLFNSVSMKRKTGNIRRGWVLFMISLIRLNW